MTKAILDLRALAYLVRRVIREIAAILVPLASACLVPKATKEIAAILGRKESPVCLVRLVRKAMLVLKASASLARSGPWAHKDHKASKVFAGRMDRPQQLLVPREMQGRRVTLVRWGRVARLALQD